MQQQKRELKSVTVRRQRQRLDHNVDKLMLLFESENVRHVVEQVYQSSVVRPNELCDNATHASSPLKNGPFEKKSVEVLELDLSSVLDPVHTNENVGRYSGYDSDFPPEESDAEDSGFDDVTLPSNNVASITNELSNENNVKTETELLQEEFAKIVREYPHVPKSFINAILTALKKHPSLSAFPKDYRTLLKTPRSCSFREVKPGLYFHFGLANGLIWTLKGNDLKCVLSRGYVEVLISTDGLPLAKSSGSCFWPILASIWGGTDPKPFIIGLYHAKEKPDCSTEFLRDFVEEAIELEMGGFELKNRIVKLKVTAIICDAPARAFICKIVGHTGKFSCPKCTVEGEWFGRTVFLEINCQSRTDESFRAKRDCEHHKGTSTLERLRIDMIASFPIDYMHAVCLGVMRKLLWAWIRGPLEVRLQSKLVTEISSRLLQLKVSFPDEFSRKPRGLDELSRWKATELRSFLLYSGPVVLAKLLPKKLYTHFLTLHLAIRILLSPDLLQVYGNDAHRLLESFVKNAMKLYGPEFMSYNVHSLLHLAPDAERFGPLDKFSAFAFENYLQIVKRMVTGHNRPLAQVVRRIMESRNSEKDTVPTQTLKFIERHMMGPLVDNQSSIEQYKKITSEYGTVTTRHPNNCVVLFDGTIVLVRNILVDSTTRCAFIVGQNFLEKLDYFVKPWPSGPFGVHQVKSLSGLQMWPLNLVKKKNVFMKCSWNSSEVSVVTELLHN